MPTFQFGTTSWDYTLTYRDDKSDVTIAVDWLDGVSVIAPSSLEVSDVEAAMRKKAAWILQKLNAFDEIKSPPSPKEFLSGEKFPYLGRYYRLKVKVLGDTPDAQLVFQQGRFEATVPTEYNSEWRQERLRELFKLWYIQHGHQKLNERLKLWSPKMECYPTKLVVKEQQTRWGSCTKSGTINLNWRVLMAPMKVVDYVLVHELAHLKYPDHSSAFWAAVKSVMPDYEERKEWLRINGATLTF